MTTARRIVRRRRHRVRLDNDARRAQLLDLACRSFADRAYDEVSIDDIARDAKISKGLLYHYFPTKRDLYVAALRVIADELVQRVAAIPRELAPADRVAASLDAYLEHISHHAHAYVALMRGGIGSDPDVAAVVEGVRGKLTDEFLTGSPLAPLFESDARVELAIRGWIGFAERVSLDWCTEPKLSRSELRDLLAQILLAILGAVVPQVLAGAL